MNASPYVIDVTAENFNEVVVEGSRRQPVLLDFWADWCQPCKTLGPILEKLADEYRGGFVVAKVNCDVEQALAMQVGVQSLPTVLLIKDGQPLDQFMGALPEGEVRAFLDKHAEKPQTDPLEQGRELLTGGDPAAAVPYLRAAREQRPDDHEVTIELARALMQSGAVDEAEALVEDLPEPARSDARVKGIKARRAFAERVAALPAAAELEQRVTTDPADGEAAIGLAVHRMAQDSAEGAMELLLAVMQKDRERSAEAREMLLEIFNILGPDHPISRPYRQRMFQLLY